MRPRCLILSLLVLSLILSAPSLVRLPRVFPFLDPEVRAAAPAALQMLRAQGLWLVNVDIFGVEKDEHAVCFVWKHRYTARTYTAPREFLTTCVHETL